MKDIYNKMNRNVFFIICWTLSLVQLVAQENHQQFEYVLQADISVDEPLFLYRPSNVFQIPDLFEGQFQVAEIPISYYTVEELALQKELNQNEEAIVTYSGGDDRFFPREIDREPITPYTWKWVSLKVNEDNGGHYTIHLRRPNSWFVENNVTHIGDQLPITVPEIGLDGIGDIISFAPNQLDTRIWDITYPEEGYVLRPITGKFTHYANNVFKIYFDQDQEVSVSVTGNHLLWSITRDTWTTVDDLEIGERLQTKKGEVVLQAKEPQEGSYKVYDLELYRDHNFLVGTQSILAHNGCDDILELKKNGKIDEFNNKLKSFKFGEHLEKKLESVKPTDMHNPHAHHIVQKVGKGKLVKAISGKSRKILEKYDIDSYFGKENLIWAPNAFNNHSLKTAEYLYERLKKADATGKADNVKKALRDVGELMAKGHFKDQ